VPATPPAPPLEALLTGQISLGHAGLYAVGAYTTALCSARLGLPFWLSAPLGVALAGLFGAALAVPSLRAKGPYLAMVTIAFGFMAEVTSNRWSLTGGPMGIMSIPPPTLPDGSSFAMMAAIRHRANPPPSKKTKRRTTAKTKASPRRH
jgi:ABC-type branched-subunit amino acid transport system permease subunit